MKTLANSQDIDALWDYSDPLSSELRFDAALTLLSPESERLLYAELLTQKARAIGLQQFYDRAKSVLNEALLLIGDYSCVALVRYFLEYGRVCNSSRENGAYDYFLKSYALAGEIHEDFYAVDAAHMLGIVTTNLESLEWNAKAMEIAENSINPRAKKWLGSLYNNTGWTYFFSENYEQAYAIFQKSKIWYAERNLRNEELIADWSLARTQRAQGKLDQALKAQLSLLHTRQSEELPEDGYVYEELGEILLLLEKKEEAYPYLEHAYSLLEHDIWLQQNEPERLRRLQQFRLREFDNKGGNNG